MMDDSTKELGVGAGLLGAGAAAGTAIPKYLQRGVDTARAAQQTAEQAIPQYRAGLELPGIYQQGERDVAGMLKERDSLQELLRSAREGGAVDMPGATYEALNKQHANVARQYAQQSDALHTVTNAWRNAQPVPQGLTDAAAHATQQAESAAARAGLLGRRARIGGGLLAAGGLALGAKGLYDHFNEKEPMKTASYQALGALAALRSLGLEKIAKMVVPGMNFSPQAMQAMEHAGTTLFSGKSANPALLAKARASSAAHGAQQGVARQMSELGASLPASHPGRLMAWGGTGTGITPQMIQQPGFVENVAPRIFGS